jgi:aspartokinase
MAGELWGTIAAEDPAAQRHADRAATDVETSNRVLTIIKIGGSVLTDEAAYRRTADLIAKRLKENAAQRLVVVVSAEQGSTDALLKIATDIALDPDPATLDLLWSTGELRSVALLTMSLQARGVRATAVNVHQTGLIERDRIRAAGQRGFRSLRLRSLLASFDVVVAPGFLARGVGDRIVSLGRGGSDLTAVLLASGLGATVCELVKDVPGYFASDPNHDPLAEHLPAIDYCTAIGLARRGSRLVQEQALEAARLHGITIVVRAPGSEQRTVVSRFCEIDDADPPDP